MTFLVDAQLPPAVAQWLRESGHDAHAVREVGLRETEDGEIWGHALATSAVIVTKDEDFPVRTRQTDECPIIVWLRIGNCSNRELQRWFLPHLPQIIEWIEQGVRVVEIR